MEPKAIPLAIYEKFETINGYVKVFAAPNTGRGAGNNPELWW